MHSVRLVLVVALLALLTTTAPAMAQPTPPPNPSDQELYASRDAVVARAAELGRLSSMVADLDRQAAEVRSALAEQREAAFQRLLELRAADDAAAEAASRVQAARVETAAAGSAIDRAQERIDEFATSTYQQNLDLGPLGLLTSATNPADLVARAEITDFVAQEQLRALDALLRANTARVNAQSMARAAEEDARARQEVAEQARADADGAVAATAAAVADHEARLRELDDRRAGVDAELAVVRTADQGLRGQRQQYDNYQRRAAEQAEEERRRAAQAAAADPPDPGPRRVDPAASGLGPQYECRAGVPRWGPVKPWVSEAGQLLRCRFGIGSVGGVGPRPNASDHPAGLALDFFVDRPTGDALAECAIRNRERLAVKYVIFRQRINNGSGWRQMEDRGSPVANHMEHVHISFNARPGGSRGSVSC
ncbi:coiled-coil domain-containing protein [Pseudonocardia saturnea]